MHNSSARLVAGEVAVVPGPVGLGVQGVAVQRGGVEGIGVQEPLLSRSRH